MASEELFSEQMQTKAQEKQRFTWKIPDFPTLVNGDNGKVSLKNVSFQVGGSIGIPTNFTCCVEREIILVPSTKWYPQYTKSYIVFSVNLEEPFPPAELAAKAFVRFTLELQSNTGKEVYYENASLDVESLLKGRSINFKYMFLDGMSVNLTATIFTVNEKPMVQLSSLLATLKERSIPKMKQDLDDAPTVIVCKDGTEFKVYRGILCARSSVFRTMFQTEMSEADSGQVKIEEIPSRALDVFLHFVHTGKLKDNWKELGILEGLTYAAHKYDVKDLFEFLDQSLGHLENCGRLMNLAKTLGMVQAEKELMDYFKREVNSIEQAARIMREAESVLDLCPEECGTGKE